MVLSVTALLTGVWFYHRGQRQAALEEAESKLSAVAELKLGAIVDWRNERIGDAKVISDDPLFARRAGEFLRRPGQERAGEILGWLALLKLHSDYDQVALYDAQGKLSIASPPVSGAADPDFANLIRETLRDGGVRMSDLRVHPGAGVRMAVIVPFRGPDQAPLGAVVLRIDPTRFLYPHMQRWPTASPSGETLLVRREGAWIVYLNDLRHRPGAALSLRLPVTRPDLPAAQAALGREGFVEGSDYRGVPVLAVIRSVPDSPWRLVAKIDRDEAFQAYRYRTRLAYVLAGLLIVAGLTGGFLLLKHREARYYRQLHDADTERRALVGHYEYLHRYANDIILLIGDDLRIVEANEPALTAYGYTREELLGLSIRELRAPQTLQEFDAQWEKADTQTGYLFETVHRRKDGSEFPVEVSSRAIDVDGRRFRQSVIRDITERKLAERRLRASEERFRAAFEQAASGMAILDTDGRFVQGNGALCSMLGYAPDELAGRKFQEVTAPEDRDSANTALRGVLAGEMASVGLETRFERKDGQTVLGSVSWAPLRDAGGRIASLIIQVEDITRRREDERALRQSQAQLARAQAIASLGSWEIENPSLAEDGRGEVYRWSAEVYRIFGVDRDRFTPSRETFFACLHPDDRSRVLRVIADALKAGREYEVEHRIVRPDGEVRYVREHAELERGGDGRVVRMIGTVQDITDYRNLEEQFRQAQKLESIGRLAGGVAHDFNNLLTVINGYADLVLSSLAQDDPLHEHLEQIRQAGEKAAGLTQQLLAFSRKQVLQAVALDLNAIVRDSGKMLKRLIGEDIELVTNLEPSLGAVLGDPGQLLQVVMNLAVNARDAMPRGGALLIETKNVELDEDYAEEHAGVAPGPYVMLAITDTGVGMDEDTRRRIFDPFFTTKPHGAGTGLGLSTVYGIVRQTGGWIWVYSEPDKGTCFKIYLPRAEAAPVAAEQASPAESSWRGNETVLLVEDQAEVRMLAASILKAYGYRVIEAANPGEALLLCERHPGRIHLLLTDVVMPGMSGRELAGRLQPLREGMKVLYMSGYTDNVIVHNGVLDQNAEYLQKPFTPKGLAAKVRAVLGAPGPAASVLVVDDEQAVRQLLAGILEGAGYSTAQAENGKRAQKMLQAQPFDLMIIDLVMPEQEGLETIREVRLAHPGLKILAVSGAFGGDFLRVARSLGAHAALQKPVAPATLVAAVERLLQA